MSSSKPSQGRTFVLELPNGRRASVSVEQARALVDRLWQLAHTRGATTAATQITEALRAGSKQPLRFDEHEAAALCRVIDPSVTWAPTPVGARHGQPPRAA